MANKFKTYLFDWDGTLADTLSVWLRVYHHIFTQIGIPMTDMQIGQEVMGDWDYWQKHGLEKYLPMVRDAEDHALYELDKVKLTTGAYDLLDKLHADGVQLGIITTTARKNLELVLQKYKLAEYFSTLVCGDDVQKRKPDPEPVLKALVNLNADPATTVMIGDTEKDIYAAKAAGVHTILLHIPGYHDIFYDESILEASEPEQTVHSLSEIV